MRTALLCCSCFFLAACAGDAPGLLSVYPQDGAKGIHLDVSVELAFDRAVKLSAATAPIVLTLDGQEVEGVVSVGEGGGPVVFTPRMFLLPQRTYQIAVREGIAGYDGEKFSTKSTWRFTTAEDCEIRASERARLSAGSDGSGGVIVPGGRRVSPPGVQIVLGSFPTNMVVSPDGSTLVATNNGKGLEPGKEQSLSVVDLSGPTVVQTVSRKRPESLFYGLEYSPDGSRLYASGGQSERIEVFNVLADGTLDKSHDIDLDGFPSGIQLDEDRGVLYVAAQGGSDAVAVDLSTGSELWRIQVGLLPYDVQLGPGKQKLYVSLWGRAALYDPGRVIVLDVEDGRPLERIEVGKNPEDLLLAPDGRLFVVCSDADRVDVIDTSTDTLKESWDLRGAPTDPVGLNPNALELDAARGRLYVTCGQRNSVEVLSSVDGTHLGAIPTAWYPTSVRLSPDGQTLYVVSGRGFGTGPNTDYADIEGKLIGILSIFPVPTDEELKDLTDTARDNINHALRFFPERCLGKAFPLPRAVGEPSPIKHVIFVLRENKTYDQNLGDLEGTNGDPSLVMFGEEVTPNLHALAREFCNLENFHVEAEVSVIGHYWNAAATLNDFAEKAWHASSRDDSRMPALGTAQVDYPPGQFIWQKLQDAGIDFRNYGEPYGVAGEYDRFMDNINMDYMLDLGINLYLTPDATRVEWFMQEVEEGIFPPFVYLSLPNDHTYGSKAGYPTARWMVAENDYATGLLVDKISHSEHWPETLIIVTEDDPQSGADHVDNHRSIALLISPYTKRGYTSSAHYGFSSLIRTYGLILGMPALNLLDRVAAPVYDCFTSVPDLRPYDVREQNVPYEENPQNVPGAYLSGRMDFSAVDRAEGLGQVLWMATRPGEPVPAQLLHEVIELDKEEEEERWNMPVPLYR
ncbi:Ig-like domain-containing protein [Myxococcota bacterium]